MDSTPKWIPILFGSVSFLMGMLILGALWGYIPTDGGKFYAPSWVIASLGICLLATGLAFWLPRQSPALIKSFVLITVVGSLMLVCNWTAFAPGVEYQSSLTLGVMEINGKDQIGGRIVFGLAAVAVDIFIGFSIYSWVKAYFRK